jgi:hypothetical protein
MIRLSAEPQAYTYFMFFLYRSKNTQIRISEIIKKGKPLGKDKKPTLILCGVSCSYFSAKLFNLSIEISKNSFIINIISSISFSILSTSAWSLVFA